MRSPTKKKRLIGTPEQGIAIREALNESAGSVFSHKRYVQFDKELIQEFKGKFEESKKADILNDSCSFESNRWEGLGNYHKKYFDFGKFEFNTELTLALKCYVVIELYDRGITIELLSNRFSQLIRALVKFNYFREESIAYFEEYIIQSQINGVNLSDFVSGVESFLYFYPLNESSHYLDILQYVRTNNSDAVREIPMYESIAWFDYLINKFMNTFSGSIVAKYYPIYLWWRITAIIPIRPIEFLNLEFNCCFLNEDDGKYYLKIPRKKARKHFYRKKVLPIIDTLETNFEIYNLITEYKRLLQIDDTEKYLLSLKAFRNVFNYDQHVIKDRLSKSNLDNLLVKFYQEIIHDHYGFKVLNDNSKLNDENAHDSIVKLKLGDTRHLAFCSMMIQGFNPLVIAQMGGHQLLETQSHYGYHLEDFIGSYTKMLAKYFEDHDQKSGNEVHEKYSTKDKINMMFRYGDRQPEREIEYGKCYSKNFPNECYYEDCDDCNFFSIDFDKLDRFEINRLSEKLEKSKKEVKAKVELLQRYYTEIVKDGSVDIQNLKCNEVVEGDLKKQSRQLKNVIENEAKLIAKMGRISKIYECKEKEGDDNIGEE